MLITDICSRLRKPRLQLPELCSLINSLGDSLVKEIMENNTNEVSVKLGWNQLIEILMQTINPTVRHMTFENVQHFLISNNYRVFDFKDVCISIYSGILKLLCHWNSEVQLELLDIIFEEFTCDDKIIKKACTGNKTLLSILLNNDIKIVARLMTLITSYNDCDQRFILKRLILSLRVGMVGIKKKEVVSEIIDRLCSLGKNIDLDSEDFNKSFEHRYEISRPYFLLLVFKVFDNIPDTFDDLKIASYQIIKEEINLLICKESLDIVNFDFYFELIENSVEIMKNMSTIYNILFIDFVEWIRISFNFLSNYLKAETIDHNKLSTILKLINPFIISIFELQYKRCQIIFIWDNELKLPFKIDNNNLSNKNISIFNIDQIIESLIEFLIYYTKNESKSKFLSTNYSLILRYISNILVMVNLGITSNETGLNILKNKRNLILNLSYHLSNYVNEISSAIDFDDIVGSKYNFESYFIINYIISKIYFISHNIINKLVSKEDKNDAIFQYTDKCGEFHNLEVIDFLENSLFPLIIKFLNMIITVLGTSYCSDIYNYFSMNENNRLRIIYHDVVSIYYTNTIPSDNNVILVILGKLYKFSNINKQVDHYLFDINRIFNGDLDSIIDKIFTNVFFTHIILSNKNIWMDVENKRKIQDVFLKNINKFKIQNKYKYGGIFCIIGHFKLAKTLFEGIKLGTIESSTWIDTLIYLSSLYDSLDAIHHFEYKKNNEENCMDEYKKLINKSRSLIDMIHTNILLVKTFMMNKTKVFFIGLYMSILTKTLDFMMFHLRVIRKQHSNTNDELRERIKGLLEHINIKIKNRNIDEYKQHLEIKKEIVMKITEILKSLFGLINITRFICKKSTKVLINLYFVLKFILVNNFILAINSEEDKLLNSNNLKMLKSYLLFVLKKTDDTIYSYSERRLRLRLEQEKTANNELLHLNSNKSKFNMLVEKSFLSNIDIVNDLNETGDDWELVKKIVTTEIDDVGLYIKEIGSRDILLEINKKYQGKVVYITYIYFKRSNIDYIEDYIEIERLNYHDVFSITPPELNNDIIHECMEITRYMASFPPLLLSVRDLAVIKLNYELKGSVRNRIDEGEIGVVPTLRLSGCIKGGFPLNFKKYWRWTRVKVSYILDSEDELISNSYLDISVKNGSFNWTQPIESVSNVKQLKITSIPMTLSKLSIGAPTIDIIPILNS